ncbi:transglutaminase domain-containing protein [Bacillus sp. 31A1R]|uniref:Transglutaminase domain-containing protein n=1 Tax=Robertmurraya mangrovi TaxID=3098077 RepID=A0ABU5J4U7_9BACI|nr:transglutaminase domain-containing protein [Bacillus sp. 31A1R]MDZ5474407.1 transglutaminase domain-containing protein [Bacillus sp. 31A1R]
MTSHTESKFDFSNLVLYVFGFFLLWEWLRPLEQLTETEGIKIFLAFLVISFALYYFSVRFIFTVLIKVIFILYFLHHLYLEGSFFSFNWFSIFTGDFVTSMTAVFTADWSSLSFMFKTLLFFVLLWLMTYLIQYWLINRRQIFIFFFMTLVYITVLDTFTPYEATQAIVRTVVTGFAVMGMLTFYRILDREKIKKEFSFSRKWMVPLVIMITLSVLVGYNAPKADPIWPDPVPFIKSYSTNSGNDGTAMGGRVGYGADDSRLGGPFMGDDQVVYRTEVDELHYWKVETKDVYTGKGWVASGEGQRVSFNQEAEVPIPTYRDVREEKDMLSHVFVEKKYPHIIYPLGVQSVTAQAGEYFDLEPVTEKIYSQESLDGFTLNFKKPSFSVKAMLATKNVEDTDLEQRFIERYTSLPENLPERVKDLAVEITEGKNTWFDKARAIERYFGRSEYYYDQVNVLVPGPQDDYVDQFLFESKRGYCDNYSSSMAVMLRTLGIPSRWVKGYTEGEFIGAAPEDKKAFNITNNNAHSWVEVFFPEVGWVPFEPTQGFDNNVIFNYDTTDGQQNNTEVPEKEEKPEVEEPEKPKDEMNTADSSFSFSDLKAKIKEIFVKKWKTVVFIVLLLGVIALLLYKYRLRWFPRYLLFRYSFKHKDEELENAYLVLLKQLNRYGLKRKENQTLREYSRYIDSFFSTKDMGDLTAHYERYLYKGTLPEGSWKDNKKLWENLIKKTTA